MQRDWTGWVHRPVGTRQIPPAGERGRRGDRPQEHKTFVFQGAEFEGTLRLRESFRIDSEFRGQIFSEGTVTVGETAAVEAEIHAREIIIHGVVAGNVSARRQLIIRSCGRLHGDAETPCLEVEKGAVFNGRSTMVRPEVAARADTQTRQLTEGPAARAGSATALPHAGARHP